MARQELRACSRAERRPRAGVRIQEAALRPGGGARRRPSNGALALRYASKKLRSDREVVLAAVNKDGIALEHASRELRSDREVVLAAVKQWGTALRYASKELQADEEVALAAMKDNKSALRFVERNFVFDLLLWSPSVKLEIVEPVKKRRICRDT